MHPTTPLNQKIWPPCRRVYTRSLSASHAESHTTTPSPERRVACHPRTKSLARVVRKDNRTASEKMPTKKRDASHADASVRFAHECKIRDAYSRDLPNLRPRERLVRNATRFDHTALIADMSTTDESGTLRIWEFKIVASYDSLGQVLVYLAQKRLDHLIRHANEVVKGKTRDIRAVLAAFDIRPEVEIAVTILNLGVELVRIPKKYMAAGDVPKGVRPTDTPTIPA